MGVGRAQDGGVARAGRHRHVVDVAAAAHEQRRILDAFQRAERAHLLAQPAPPAAACRANDSCVPPAADGAARSPSPPLGAERAIGTAETGTF